MESKIGSIIKVAYKPQFSKNFKSFVKLYVAPSLCSDIDEHQYFIEDIWEQIEGLKYKISEEDEKLLNYLSSSFTDGGLGVEYIEF